MYEIQEKPDENVPGREGYGRPVATLKDEYGGISHIVLDDHCYVLLNGSEDGTFSKVWHWYPEAVEAMKSLPTPRPA